MTVLLVLLCLCLSIFFLNLFFVLAKVERSIQLLVPMLEKFMTVRYNLKKDSQPNEEANPSIEEPDN